MKFIYLHPSSSAFHSTARGALQALGQSAIFCGQEEATNFARTEHGANLMKAARIPREGKIPLGLLQISEGRTGDRKRISWGDVIRPFHWLSINSSPWRFVLCSSAPPLYPADEFRADLFGFFPARGPERTHCWDRHTQVCKGTGAFPFIRTLISNTASYQPCFLPT